MMSNLVKMWHRECQRWQIVVLPLARPEIEKSGLETLEPAVGHAVARVAGVFTFRIFVFRTSECVRRRNKSKK